MRRNIFISRFNKHEIKKFFDCFDVKAICYKKRRKKRM